MAFPQIAKVNVTGAKGIQGEKGNPGGNAAAVGLLSKVSAITVPIGTDQISVSGLTVLGDIGAGMTLVFDSVVDAAYVSANPTISALDAGGRGFRRADPLRSDLAAVGGIDMINDRPSGIVADNVTNDGPAIAAKTSGIIFPRQTHYIGTSQNIDVPMDVRAGTKFRLAAGVTLTPRAGFRGDIAPIFEGTGTVNFRLAEMERAYAEWWGAVTNTNGFNCKPMMDAAIASGVELQLLAADYYIATALACEGHGARIRGLGMYRVGLNTGSRIIVQSATESVIVAGFATAPLTGGVLDINALALGVELRDFEVTRDRAPDITAAPLGIYVKNAQDAIIERVKSQQSHIGFAASGTVNTTFKHLRATRTLAGTGSGADYFTGFALLTDAPPFSSINGNASCWIDHCIAVCSTSLPNTVGLKINGKFTDVFIDRFEAASARVQIDIVGDKATHSGSAADRTNSNVQITNTVLDQFATAGIRIADLNKFGSVRISGDFYVGPSASATAGILCNGNLGSVVIEGSGEFAMIAGTTCYGISATDCKKMYVGAGIVIHEAGDRAISLSNVSQSRFECRFDNESRTANQGILASGTCDSNVYAITTTGKASGFGFAVALLGSGHTRSTFDGAGISFGTTGSGKLYSENNTPQIVAADGAFDTTNRARGVA